MKPAWEFYSQRRGISIEGLIRQGITTFEALEQYCNQRGVESPSRELFQETYNIIHKPAPVPAPPKKKPAKVKQPEPAPKKPAVKRTRRKKAAT